MPKRNGQGKYLFKVFTKCIVAYHETFAQLGLKKGKVAKKDTISVVWHEGIAKRNAEDIISNKYVT